MLRAMISMESGQAIYSDEKLKAEFEHKVFNIS
jgi:hypothetical protein